MADKVTPTQAAQLIVIYEQAMEDRRIIRQFLMQQVVEMDRKNAHYKEEIENLEKIVNEE